MALRPVGLEYVSRGGQEFLKTVSQSNQATQQFVATLIQGQQQSSIFASITEGAFARIGSQLVSFAMQGASAVSGWMQSGLQLSASMEQAQVAFTTLLGSAEEATAFLGELRDFAAKTPFEFPGLQDAARRLLAFKFSAEEIIPTMTSIGDAVGALGGSAAEIQRVVYGLGQMKAKGRVANEELMQLAELGIPVYQILGDALGKSTKDIQEMVSKGLLPAEQGVKMLLDGFTRLYGGSMQAQAVTFNGLMSTLKDNLGLALQAFSGGAFQTAKSALIDLGNIVGSPAFQNFATVVGEEIGTALSLAYNYVRALASSFMELMPAISTSLETFRSFADQARAWGANIVSELAVGMWQAVKYVIAVIQQIGAVIASWLAPGSPPAILPDLPAWGTSAVNEWIKGWGQPDLAVFQDLSNTITGVLQNLIDPSTMSEAAFGQMTLSMRDAIGGAVEEFRTLGSVSDETFSKIAEAAGPAGPAVEALARTYFELQEATREVAAAQEELNAVTEQYADAVAPLNKELEALRDRKEEIKEAERIQELNEKIADAKTTEADRELAQIELQEIALENQLEGVEEERDAAIKAAEEKLKAAEENAKAVAEQYALQEAQLQATSDQNQLIQQQIDLIKRLVEEQKRAAEAAAKSAAAGGGGGGAGVGGIGGGPGGLGGLAGSLTGGLDAGPVAEVKEAVEQLGSAVADTKEAYGEWNAQGQIAKQNVQETITAAQEFLAPLNEVKVVFAEIGAAIAVTNTPLQDFYATLLVLGVPVGTVVTIGSMVQEVFNGVALAFHNVTSIAAGFGMQLGLLEEPANRTLTPLEQIGATLAIVGQRVGEFLSQIMPLQNVLFAIGAVIGGTVLSSLYGMAAALAVAAAPILAMVATVAILKTAWDTNFGGIRDVTASVMESVSAVVSTVLAGVTTFWNENGAQITATLQQHWMPVGEQIGTLMTTIGTLVSTVLSSISAFWAEHGSTILSLATSVFLSVSGTISSAMTTILGIINMVLAEITKFWQTYGADIMQIGMGIFQYLVGVIQIFSSVAMGIWQGFLKLFQGDWDGMLKAVGEALLGAIDGLKTALSGLWSIFEPVLRIVWKSFVDWASTMGGDVVAGVVKGISDNASKVASKLLDMAKEAMSAVASFLGISSPATTFIYFGKMIDLGLAVGIEANVPVVTDAITELMTQMRKFAVTEADEMVKEIISKLDEIQTAAMSARAGLASGIGSGYGIIRGLIDTGENVAKLQKDLKDSQKALEDLIKQSTEAGEKASVVNQQREALKGVYERAQAEEARIAAEQARLVAGEEQLEAQRKRLKDYDEELQDLERELDREGASQEAMDAVALEREHVADQVEFLSDQLEELNRVQGLVNDDLKLAADYRKDIGSQLENTADQYEKLIQVQIDSDAKAGDLAEEHEQRRQALVEAQQRYQQQVELQLEMERRLAEVRGKALTMSEKDAIAAKEFLDFETAQLSQEAQLRAAIINEQSLQKRKVLEEELKAVLAAQELETTLFERQAEQRANARKAELEGVRKDFFDFLEDLSKRPEYGDIGHEVIRGLGKGITEELANLQGVLGDVVDTMILALKNALGITSPSKVIDELIGQPAGEGLLVGFGSKMRELPQLINAALAATERLSEPLIYPTALPGTYSGASYMGGGGSQSVTNNYNYSPTYGGAPKAPMQNFRVMKAMNTHR